jgi:hypothetical protein
MARQGHTELRAPRAKPDYVKLFGLLIYIVTASWGCAAVVYTAVQLIRGDFHVTVSLAHVVAAAVFFAVAYALYEGHVQIGYLARCWVAKHIKRYKLTYAVTSFVVTAIIAMPLFFPTIVPGPPHRPTFAERWPEAPMTQWNLPPGKRTASNDEIPIASRPALEPMPQGVPSSSDQTVDHDPTLPTNQLPSTEVGSINNVPLPRPSPIRKTTFNAQIARSCNLGEVFSGEQYEACLRSLRRHPPRTGTGGPGRYGEQMPLDIRPNKFKKPSLRRNK